jgi:hypothetical protein
MRFSYPEWSGSIRPSRSGVLHPGQGPKSIGVGCSGIRQATPRKQCKLALFVTLYERNESALRVT